MSAGRHERDDCQVCKPEEPMMVAVVAGGGDPGNDVMLKDVTRIQPGGMASKKRCKVSFQHYLPVIDRNSTAIASPPIRYPKRLAKDHCAQARQLNSTHL